MIRFGSIMRSVLFLLTLVLNTVQAQYFQLAFDNGHVDSFDSNHGLFKREMCEVDDQWTSVNLKNDEIQSLLPLIDGVNFFALPQDQIESKLLQGDKNIILTCSPCAQSQLQIKLGNKSNKIIWDCGCATKKSSPDLIKPLVEGIKTMLYERKKIKSLAPTDCGFI